MRGFSFYPSQENLHILTLLPQKSKNKSALSGTLGIFLGCVGKCTNFIIMPKSQRTLRKGGKDNVYQGLLN